MLYVYDGAFAIGYMDGERFVPFASPIRADMLG